MRGTPGGKLGGALLVEGGAADLVVPVLLRLEAEAVVIVVAPRPSVDDTLIFPLATLLLVVVVIVVRLAELEAPSISESFTVMLPRLSESLLEAICEFCKLF